MACKFEMVLNLISNQVDVYHLFQQISYSVHNGSLFFCNWEFYSGPRACQGGTIPLSYTPGLQWLTLKRLTIPKCEYNNSIHVAFLSITLAQSLEKTIWHYLLKLKVNCDPVIYDPVIILLGLYVKCLKYD